MHEVREGLWAFFPDCAFRVLIGWAGKFHSQSSQELLAVVVTNQARVTLFSRIKVFHKLMLKRTRKQQTDRRVYTN